MIFKFTEVEKIDPNKSYAILLKTESGEFETTGVTEGDYALRHQDEERYHRYYLTEINPEQMMAIAMEL